MQNGKIKKINKKYIKKNTPLKLSEVVKSREQYYADKIIQ